MLNARRMMVHLQLRVPSGRILSTRSLWLLTANLEVKNPNNIWRLNCFTFQRVFPLPTKHPTCKDVWNCDTRVTIEFRPGLVPYLDDLPTLYFGFPLTCLYEWDYHPSKLPRLPSMKPWPTWTCPQSRSSKILILMTAKLLPPSDHERHIWWTRLWRMQTWRLYPAKRYFAQHWKKYENIQGFVFLFFSFYLYKHATIHIITYMDGLPLKHSSQFLYLPSFSPIQGEKIERVCEGRTIDSRLQGLWPQGASGATGCLALGEWCLQRNKVLHGSISIWGRAMPFVLVVL